MSMETPDYRTTMVKEHCGRWIPSDTRSMAGIVSQMMGFEAEQGGA